MYYHKWPEHGKGSNSYLNNDGNTLSRNFENDIFENDKKLETYDYLGSEEKIKTVALLMLDCGLASNCSYTSNWSGAMESMICNAFNNYFDYTAAHYEQNMMGNQHFYEIEVSEIQLASLY